jgi:hypothetical protein
VGDRGASVTSFILPSHRFVKNDLLCFQLLSGRIPPSFTFSHPLRFSRPRPNGSSRILWRYVFSEGKGGGGVNT